ncbi:unnamed protein product, partial [Nezara viridula]
MFHQGVFLLLVFAAAAANAINNITDPKKVLTPQDACIKGKCLSDILDSLQGSYQILPGVNISSSAVAGRSTTAAEALTSYLKSLTLHVALYNEPMYSFFGGIERGKLLTTRKTGRKKRPSYFHSLRFRFLSLYTVFAVAFALVSALVGKAVTLSVIALVIAGIAAARGVAGFGFGFGAPNSPTNTPPVFDIIRRPHVQVQHIHSAEEIYEPGKYIRRRGQLRVPNERTSSASAGFLPPPGNTHQYRTRFEARREAHTFNV